MKGYRLKGEGVFEVSKKLEEFESHRQEWVTIMYKHPKETNLFVYRIKAERTDDGLFISKEMFDALKERELKETIAEVKYIVEKDLPWNIEESVDFVALKEIYNILNYPAQIWDFAHGIAYCKLFKRKSCITVAEEAHKTFDKVIEYRKKVDTTKRINSFKRKELIVEVFELYITGLINYPMFKRWIGYVLGGEKE